MEENTTVLTQMFSSGFGLNFFSSRKKRKEKKLKLVYFYLKCISLEINVLFFEVLLLRQYVSDNVNQAH